MDKGKGRRGRGRGLCGINRVFIDDFLNCLLTTPHLRFTIRGIAPRAYLFDDTACYAVLTRLQDARPTGEYDVRDVSSYSGPAKAGCFG
jgi:hypothetical protein